MNLSFEDMTHFYRLLWSLMFYVNQKLKVLDEEIATPDAFSAVAPEKRLEVHQALLEHLDLIDAFADENPLGLSETDRGFIRSWKHLVAGTFYAFRQLRKYMVFLSSTSPVVAYGVVALFDPFEIVVGPYLPRMVKTILLPYKGQIVYDGFVTGYNVSFGAGIRRRLNESYKEAKARHGIVTSLPMPAEDPRPDHDEPIAKTHSTRGRRTAVGPTSRDAARSAHDAIVRLTDAFCRDHLDAEYGDQCRKLAGVLARKRPSPLIRGKLESWASGIARVIGWVNFLDDRSQPLHMRLSDIDKLIGVSEATGTAKSLEIRRLLKIHRFDPEWTLPSKIGQNPMVWMFQVNGLPMDLRQAPREIQEAAFRKGLIPYIPGDREPE